MTRRGSKCSTHLAMMDSVFRDGRIRKDEANPEPPRARDVLQTLPTLED